MNRFLYLLILSVFTIPSFAFGQQQLHPGWNAMTGNLYSPSSATLLSDGTVLLIYEGDSVFSQILTPDRYGSYANGTLSAAAALYYKHLYCGIQVLRDGRVIIAGGEYGNGRSAEIYDPATHIWSLLPSPPDDLSDCESEMLPDGRVLFDAFLSQGTYIFDPTSNAWSAGPSPLRYQDEATWVKLPDDSILAVDPVAVGGTSERMIPSGSGYTWTADANLPFSLYSSSLGEMGPGFLLPDGKVIFFGGNGHSAIYSPGSNGGSGTWASGPSLPNVYQGPSGAWSTSYYSGSTPNPLCCQDAAGAMMANGDILLATSPYNPTSAYNSPVFMLDFHYNPSSPTLSTFSFTPSLYATSYYANEPSYVTRLLDLPDGSVLEAYGSQIYKPSGAPLPSGQPTISQISINDDASYLLTGTLLNGISQGGSYGDDFQDSTNRPIVKLTDPSGLVFYCRTYNWSSTSVMTGSQQLSTQFAVPAGLPRATYSLTVSANGISSAPTPFVYVPVVLARLTSPTIGSTFSGSSVTFNWSAGTASTYWLYVGTTPGGNDLFNSQEFGTSATVSGLPVDGRTVYFSLYSYINGRWFDVTSSYTSASLQSKLINQTQGQISAATHLFSWTSGTGVTQNYLEIGSSAGGTDIYNMTNLVGVTSETVSLPTDGRLIYVALGSYLNGEWVVSQYTFSSASLSPIAATMSSVSSGSVTLNSSTPIITGSTLASGNQSSGILGAATTVNFTWHFGGQVSDYYLQIGSTPGESDLFNRDEGFNLSEQVTNLPLKGEQIYVTLWTRVQGVWQATYSSYVLPVGYATMTSPANGSTLASATQTFSWSTGVNVTSPPYGGGGYWLFVGSTDGGNDLFNQQEANTSAVVSNLPSDGRTIYVTLFSYTNGQWLSSTSTYTCLSGQAAITSPVNGSTFTSASQTFTWSTGVNVTSPPYGGGGYWLYVGSTAGGNDLFNHQEATTSATVPVPVDGRTVYVTLFSYIGNQWLTKSTSYTCLSPQASISTPTAGSTFSSSSQTFTWTTGTGVTTGPNGGGAYWLYVGSNPGGSDLFNQQESTTSATVTNLPVDGRTVYATLYTFVGNQWLYKTTSYTCLSPQASISSPAAGSTFSSSSQAFTWTTGTGVTTGPNGGGAYWLYVGSSPGGNDLFNQQESTTSATVTNLPVDGKTVYVTLYTFVGNQWLRRVTTYTCF